MVSERELLLDAEKNLISLTRRNDIIIKPSGNRRYDTDINIGEVKLIGEVKSYVNNANFNQMLIRLQEISQINKLPVLLIVGDISPCCRLG